MHLATTKLHKTLTFDIDGDGSSEEVDFVEADFHYPLLARWTKENNGRKTTHWAVASHFLVRASQQVNRDQLNRAVIEGLADGALPFRKLSAPKSFRVGPPASGPDFRDLGERGEVLRRLESLRSRIGQGFDVEPDYLYFTDAFPSDQDFPQQQRTMTLIDAPQAWDMSRGSNSVIVAVIDTGIDYEHPDIKANVLRTGGEIVGWDFHNGKPDPGDDHWHGTYCAGLIGAVGGNGLGIAGVNWRVSLMPVKAFNADGVGTSTHAVDAIRFAVDRGAKVILCAWGSAGNSTDLRKAIQYADEKEVLVVVAAGNTGAKLEDSPHFPASAAPDLPNLISVSATNDKDELLPDSASSPTKVHLSAPGEGVYSTFPTALRPYLPYHVSDGTSPAAALVAGACALLRAHADASGNNRSHLDIRKALLDGVDKSRKLEGTSTSGGRLNLAKALNLLVRPTTPAVDPPSPDLPPPHVHPPGEDHPPA